MDTTIKPAMLAMVRSVGEPYETNLAAMATWAWQRCLAGEVWAMPAAHWAYELSDGSREWLPGVIEGLGLDVELLRGRNNAAAIEFSTMETAKFEGFIQHLLERLGQSDFTLAFPERGTVCTVHHHKQLWWVTPHARVVEALDELMRSGEVEKRLGFHRILIIRSAGDGNSVPAPAGAAFCSGWSVAQ